MLPKEGLLSLACLRGGLGGEIRTCAVSFLSCARLRRIDPADRLVCQAHLLELSCSFVPLPRFIGC